MILSGFRTLTTGQLVDELEAHIAPDSVEAVFILEAMRRILLLETRCLALEARCRHLQISVDHLNHRVAE